MGGWEMTEDEAKTKWCPHARIATYTLDGSDGITASNKTSRGAIRDGAFCIAGRCMAWRETLPVSLSSINRAVTVQVPTGYCGLAGPVT